MKINIGNDFYIRNDYKHSVALCKQHSATNKSTGEDYEREKVLGYFPSVSSAVKKYMQLELNNSDQEYTDLKEYVVKLENLFKEVERNINDKWVDDTNG